MQSGQVIELDVAKAAAGGRMLGRHDGQVVLLWGGIPGERVRVRIDRVGKGVAYGDTVEVLDASLDRRASAVDWRCGGNALAHVRYERQVRLKGEIIADAFARIGRIPLAAPPDVVASPEQGYRMRARLHVRHGRIGFFREGSHDLCDPGPTGQLLPGTIEWLGGLEAAMRRELLRDVLWLEVAENIAGDQRGCHLELAEGARPAAYEALLTGCAREVSDTVHARAGDRTSALRLRRDARAFFQGNRFLLEPLVQRLVGLVPPGPVIDLYAGVGLFGLSLAAAGYDQVTLVEGDAISGADLRRNAEPFGPRVTVEHRSVEAFVGGRGAALRDATLIVDPPRTGLSREALAGIIEPRPPRIVYVSCDVATLARDARALVDAGYALDSLTGIDLFPNTAHVESIAVFERAKDTK